MDSIEILVKKIKYVHERLDDLEAEVGNDCKTKQVKYLNSVLDGLRTQVLESEVQGVLQEISDENL